MIKDRLIEENQNEEDEAFLYQAFNSKALELIFNNRTCSMEDLEEKLLKHKSEKVGSLIS